jgi:hypothetical protein
VTPDLIAALETALGHPAPQPLPWDEGLEQRIAIAADKAWLDRHYGETT